MCQFSQCHKTPCGSCRGGLFLSQVQKTPMDFDTFANDLFAEINDMEAEIFDVIEEEKFNVDEYINGNTDY